MRGGLLAALVGFLALTLAAAPAGASGSHALISGSGSSWAFNAVNQWVGDVQQQRGLKVVFTSTGSATGRQDFASSTNDFAVSDIGYQGTDKQTGNNDSSSRPYVYLPIVAGGTAFPYQIHENGQLVRNLRLGGETLAKIFTGQITSWGDPAITKDNNGRVLPSEPIYPVIHSEGSGSTAQFTTYLAKRYPDIWGPFAGGGFTEYYPTQKADGSPWNYRAQNGSDGVMNFLTAGGSEGAIGYDEYSYSLGKGWPVAKIKNLGGYYTLPNQYNVAVALTKAEIIGINDGKPPTDPNYLLQKLDNVFVNPDQRTYPLSSYSYGIIPTSPSDSQMTTAKRQTLVDYLYYSVCDGQQEIGPIGYSPLPLNLVQASISQIAKLKDADPAVDIAQRDVTSCNNPTFTPGDLAHNHLADIAPLPPACDQDGQGPCDDSGKAVVVLPGSGGAGSGPSSAASSSASSGPGTAASSGPAAEGGKAGPSAVKGAAATKRSGATTGGYAHSSGAGATQSVTAGPEASAAPSKTSLADGPPIAPYRKASTTRLLGLLALVLLLMVLATPPVLVVLLGRKRKEDS